ncbi:MAG: RNA pseudouridine synthase [Treponema sp.]|nr:RNA pseudouridine synthase [Treponema sp.]
MGTPWVVDETPSYAVVFKPPRVHTVPLKGVSGQETLLHWCGGLFPQALQVRGKHPWEGGIVHRLDYETQGLVLVAKTQAALAALSAQQQAGAIIKEYTALSAKGAVRLPGFPPPFPCGPAPYVITSGFRPYGPGRKAVRPTVTFPERNRKSRRSGTLDQGRPYLTEILIQDTTAGLTAFRLRIKRGFRHQIRCHLAWIGYPILNDGLYGGLGGVVLPRRTLGFDGADFPALGLIAEGMRFYDPDSGASRQYSLSVL